MEADLSLTTEPYENAQIHMNRVQRESWWQHFDLRFCGGKSLNLSLAHTHNVKCALNKKI